MKNSGEIPVDEAEITRMRLHALNRANILSRLLDERYFPDIAIAMKSKNQELFEQTCRRAEISEEMMKNLWKMMMQHGITFGDIIW
ncbi:MAG: hypothetical protein PVH73_10335 [Candidatus Bathyarchaeota archaeon]